MSNSKIVKSKEVSDMKVFNVTSSLRVGNNTSIVIDDKCIDLKNGMGILDANGKPYIILSIGMANTKGNMETTNLLIEGEFNSKKVFV